MVEYESKSPIKIISLQEKNIPNDSEDHFEIYNHFDVQPSAVRINCTICH